MSPHRADGERTAKSLRVLIVEDSEDDAVLVQRLLRAGGYDLTFERVDTPGPFRELLMKRPWDIVLCDYSMPHFDGLSALRILKALGNDIPFILVSGTIGEDVAVSAMKEGASDYILKKSLTRLVPAVERELREAQIRRERKRIEQELIQSEKKFRTLFERMPTGLFHVAPDGRLLEANPTLLRLLGLPDRGHALGLNMFARIPDREARERFLAKLEREGESEIQFEIERATGGPIWVHGLVHAVRGSVGELAYYEGSLEDITLRKLVEEVTVKCRTDHLWHAMFRTFGRGAAAVLYQAGLTAGATTYDFLRETWKPGDDEGVITALEEHFRVAGLLLLRDGRVDRERGQLAVELTRSFEAATFKGETKEPVCHFLRGLFCGLGSKILGGGDFVADEATCEGRGDASCRIQVHRMFERAA